MTNPQKFISAYLDDELTDQQFAELAAWIREDPANMADFVRAASTHSSLRDLLQSDDICGFLHEPPDEGSEIELLVNAENILSMLEEEEEASQRKQEARRQEQKIADEAERRNQIDLRPQHRINHRPHPIVIPWSVMYASVGTVAAGLVLLVYSLWPEQDQGAPVQALVASIDDSTGARWSDPDLSTASGTRLAPEPFVLSEGVVQIAFDEGAVVVIEAPAAFELVSANLARLTSGKLTGTVPPRAIGFTIETPEAIIVDLGTQFGVESKQEGVSDIQVYEGLVELRAVNDDAAAPPRQLTAGSAVQVDTEGTVTTIAFSADRFARKIPTVVVESKTISASTDARLVDLDNDGLGDRVDLLDQPPVDSEGFGSTVLAGKGQLRVGVGERNVLDSADGDQRRYCIAFALSDAQRDDIAHSESIQLGITLMEKANVGQLRVALHGVLGPTPLAPAKQSYQAPSELLVAEAFNENTPIATEELLDVTQFAKTQVEQGHKTLVFRLQIEGGPIPNQDGLHNSFVFSTLQAEEESHEPSMHMRVARLDRGNGVGASQP